VSTWLQLATCLLVIGTAGTQLTRFADAIAERSGLSRSWVGLALIATVTTLPELSTGISAVTLAGEPDMAVGDLLGSCVFNLFILVVLDVFCRRESFYTGARQGHIVSAGFGTVLIGFAGFSLMLYQHEGGPTLGHVGLYTPALLMLYAFSMRNLYRYEREQVYEFIEEEPARRGLTLRRAIAGYVATGLIVVAAGSWLPFVGAELAEQMGWGRSFVATLFIAAVTSTPEAVVTLAALRLGAVDLAIGNLLGSNLVNIAFLAIDDAFYLPGALFSSVSPAHAASAFSAMTMNGLAIVGLTLRPATRVMKTVSWVSLLLRATYFLNALFLYLRGMGE